MPSRFRISSTKLTLALRAEAARSLPAPCPRCSKLVTADQLWDLDHVVALGEGGAQFERRNLAPAHRSCNRSHGARLGNALRRARATRIREW